MRTLSLWLFSTILLDAATYTVKAGGGGDYKTIQACATAMYAGDTCTVYGGTYNENVTVSAGTAGSYKTINVNSLDAVYVLSFTMGSYTKVIGFHIQNPSSPNNKVCVSMGAGVNHVYVTNNVMYGCGSGTMINTDIATGVSYIYIQGNTLSYACVTPATLPGTCHAMSLNGNHLLVENNDLSHFDLGIVYSTSYSVFRGNTIHDVIQSECPSPTCHTDFIFTEPTVPGGPPAQYNLLENNTGRNGVGSDAKAFLSQGDACSGQCYNLIIRFNNVAHLGSGGIVDENAGRSGIPGFSYVKSYNNTWVDTNNYAPLYQGTNYFANNSTHGANINDLFYYPRALESFNPYATDSSTAGTFSAGHNLAYCTASPCNLLGRLYNSGSFTDDPGNQIADPKFVNYAGNDFRLAAGSPAIGAGTYLTTVASSDSGSGPSVVVNDASFFQDGYGIAGVNGDCISVGTATNHVCISSINYQTNTITLASAITRSAGDAVWLYSDSTGRQVLFGSAPNIGADPRSSQAPPAPPANLTLVIK